MGMGSRLLLTNNEWNRGIKSAFDNLSGVTITLGPPQAQTTADHKFRRPSGKG